MKTASIRYSLLTIRLLLATHHSLTSRHRFLGLFGALALVRVEELLAQADRFRRHLDELVVLDIGERLFQRHPDRRRQPHRLVLGRGADVGELLALERSEEHTSE